MHTPHWLRLWCRLRHDLLLPNNDVAVPELLHIRGRSATLAATITWVDGTDTSITTYVRGGSLRGARVWFACSGKGCMELGVLPQLNPVVLIYTFSQSSQADVCD